MAWMEARMKDTACPRENEEHIRSREVLGAIHTWYFEAPFLLPKASWAERYSCRPLM